MAELKQNSTAKKKKTHPKNHSRSPNYTQLSKPLGLSTPTSLATSEAQHILLDTESFLVSHGHFSGQGVQITAAMGFLSSGGLTGNRQSH